MKNCPHVDATRIDLKYRGCTHPERETEICSPVDGCPYIDELFTDREVARHAAKELQDTIDEYEAGHDTHTEAP